MIEILKCRFCCYAPEFAENRHICMKAKLYVWRNFPGGELCEYFRSLPTIEEFMKNPQFFNNLESDDHETKIETKLHN